MLLLSILSILAYNCIFQDIFMQSPFGYMFHLLYYRSHHCDASIDWSIFGIENTSSLVEPMMPYETAAVKRTVCIAVIQLIFNTLLIITSVNMLSM